jgi:site-specific DNA-cytosine methylase
MTLAEVNAAMGLPEDFSTPCLTLESAYAVRGNGVPIQMGKAIARAVKEALRPETNRRDIA